MQNKQEKDKIKVGVLRGGTGKNYESSLMKGGDIIFHILKNLSDKYKTVDIFIDKNGNWHANGLPVILADLVRKVDVVWNAVHPNISSSLKDFSIPHISNNIFSSALENNREMLLEHMKSIGVDMPRFIISPKNAREVFKKFSSPWIVKINNEIRLVKTFNELAETMKDKNDVIVEEFISGKVGSIHSLTKFRGEDIYVFPPKNFINNEKEKIIVLVKELHKHLGTKHYLKSNFVLHPKRGFFLTSINFSPDFKEGSNFYHSCELVGAKMHHIIEHFLDRA